MANNNEKEWTIMVYMAGDNNLSSDMANALEELTNVKNKIGIGLNDKVSFLVYYDSGALTTPTFYFDFADLQKPFRIPAQSIKKRYLTKRQKRQLQTARSNGGVQTRATENAEDSTKATETEETNSATAYGIMNFVDWCVNQQGHRAENYALIFSGHSFGFHGTSFMRDENPIGFMTLSRFKYALEQISGITGNDELLKQKISILGFDSCVMSMLEIGYEFRDVADFMVASEGSIPNAGWNYGNIIRTLTAQNGMNDARSVAEKLVEAYIGRQKDGAIGGQSIDISAWDLSKVEAVAISTSDLGYTLYTKLNLPAKGKDLSPADIVIYEQMNRAILQSHWKCQTYMHNQCVDLKDFCQLMLVELSCLEMQIQTVFGKEAISNKDSSLKQNFWNAIEETKSVCQNVVSAIDECVVLCGFSGEEYQFSNGISLFFPWSEIAYLITRFNYEKLEFTKEIGKNWDDFLAFYVCLATKRLPRMKEVNFELVFETLVSLSPLTRDNLPIKRDNLPIKRDNLPIKRGDFGGYLDYFGRFKNFPLFWEVAGYAKDFATDTSCEYFDKLQNNEVS